VPADRFSRSTPSDFGSEALRVAAKLANEPIEDVRIDFEDGYGVRSDEEEDGHIAQVVEAVATADNAKNLPHYWGLRVKSFADGGHERSLRTLDGFLTSLRARFAGALEEVVEPTVKTAPCRSPPSKTTSVKSRWRPRQDTSALSRRWLPMMRMMVWQTSRSAR
jgi:hypothetical protein